MSAIFGKTVTLWQAHGPDIQLRVTGDEFYATYESMDGYTAVNDQDLGQFCHGCLDGGMLISSGIPLGAAPPAGTVRHLREAPDMHSGRREARRLRTSSPVASARHRGLLDGRSLSRGRVRGLTILVDFQDLQTETTARDISGLLNGEDYKAHGNFCSVRAYFRAMSTGRLDYENDVFGPCRLSRERSFYVHVDDTLMVKEALGLAVAAGVDLRNYDSRHEGVVDAINIMYAGRTQYQGSLWPHAGSMGLDHGSGVTGNMFLVAGAGRGGADLGIGDFCHESGHLLCRFPDMYDYANDSGGVGVYCVMGSGADLDAGRTPSPVCAYLRDLAGWCGSEIDLNSAVDVEAVHGAYDTVLKFRTPAPNEYFLVENRTRIGLDRHLPASGLAIYHCDTLGSSEFQQGTAQQHYQCALLQADGRFHLERYVNQGDECDLFSCVDGVAASRATTPSTRLWSGIDSGFVISNVTAADERMRFRVGAGPTKGEIAPNLPISPRASVASVIAIADTGTVGALKVAIDITHTNLGHLSFDLVSPSGHHVALNPHRAGDPNDLRVTYDSAAPSPLLPLIGQPMHGNWTLFITDPGTGTRGTFKKWSVEIAPAP